jgi:hypothetical protein
MAERKFPNWATDNTNLPNGDANKEDPGLVKQALGWVIEKPLVQYANWLQNLIGHFVTSNNQVRVEATGFEAEAGQIIEMDNSAGSVTGLLPASPVDGQWVVFGGTNNYDTYTVTIDGNGNDVMAAADTSCLLDIADIKFIFHWDATANLWKIGKQSQDGRV